MRTFEPSITTTFNEGFDYASYLNLEKLLEIQVFASHPPHHDEALFIIQHQTSELWMKLLIHELEAAIQFIQKDDLAPSFKILSRVKQIQRMLFEQWAVLETLTPSEYAQFRGFLKSASGLQSYQYRIIEFLFGNKDRPAVKVFAKRPAILQRVTEVLDAPSLYDEFLRCLARQGFAIPADKLERDFSLDYSADPAITDVYLQIYQEPSRYWAEYEMCEKLVDVDEAQALWRFRHLKTVERIIGFKRGTGGSSGAAFLKAAVDTRLFPELWDVRTIIGS